MTDFRKCKNIVDLEKAKFQISPDGKSASVKTTFEGSNHFSGAVPTFAEPEIKSVMMQMVRELKLIRMQLELVTEVCFTDDGEM